MVDMNFICNNCSGQKGLGGLMDFIGLVSSKLLGYNLPDCFNLQVVYLNEITDW